MEEKKLFNKILDESIEKKLLISIYDNRSDTDKFSVGYVITHFNDSVLLHSVDKYSQYSGYELRPIEDIFKIGQTTEYNNNLDITYSESPFLLHNEMIQTISEKESGISAIIEFCFQNKVLLKTYFSYGDQISGFIKEINDDYFLIDSYYIDGSYEGTYLVQKSNISLIDFDSENEKKLERLINKNKNPK